MMQGQCKDCGCMCLLDELWERYGCPACRAARVAEAFRPLDPLRTAQGIPGSFTINKAGEIKAVEDNPHEHTCMYPEAEDCKACDWFDKNRDLRAAMGKTFSWHGEEKVYDDTSRTEAPRGCKMPQGSAAQTYELRRLFRI